MFGFQSIAFNISAGHLKLLSRFGTLVDRARERTVATDMIKRLAVRTPHERQPISAMSGGNAQKVVLARQLVERPEVLVLAEPTQGVDVGAKEEIHRIITELAENGTAVLVVTSDLPEALRISDRLQVVRGGTTTVEFGPDATQVDVLAAAAGAEHDGGATAGHERIDRPPRPERTATPASRRRAPPKARNRILPSPVTGQELVLIGVIAVIWVGLALGHAGVPHRGLDPAAAGGHRADRPDRRRHDDHHHHRRDRRLGRRRDHGLLGDHREGAGRRGVAGCRRCCCRSPSAACSAWSTAC